MAATESLFLYRYATATCQWIMLPRMKRGGNADQYRRMIDNIRTTVPEVAMRTTFIAGYPGETDEDFQVMKDFVKRCRIRSHGSFYL